MHPSAIHDPAIRDPMITSDRNPRRSTRRIVRVKVAERSIDCRATATIIWGLVPDRIADKPTSRCAEIHGATIVVTGIETLQHSRPWYSGRRR